MVESRLGQHSFVQVYAGGLITGYGKFVDLGAGAAADIQRRLSGARPDSLTTERRMARSRGSISAYNQNQTMGWLVRNIKII
jgi:hypothetical protein